MPNKPNQPQKTTGLFILLITVLFSVIIITITVSDINGAFADAEQMLDLSEDYPNCRFGFTPLGGAQAAKMSEFGVGWYINFGSNKYNTADPAIEYAPMIRVHQDKDGEGNYLDTYTTSPTLTNEALGVKLTENPGAIWMVGNEVDREIAQDDIQPDMYARIYHDTYEFIKSRDPEARVAISGLVQVTPGRLQYLDKVWNAYQTKYAKNMPVDVWNMHIYILPEVDRTTGEPNNIASTAVGTDIALGKRDSGGNPSLCNNPDNDTYCFADHDNISFFEWQVRAMRSWMKEHGQQNKPLILSEFSILYPYVEEGDGCFLMDEYGQCFTSNRVSTFLHNSFDYLDGEDSIDLDLGYPLDGYRMVQQSQWFSGYYSGAGYVSNLYTTEALTQISPVGLTFQQEMAARTALPNLKPIQVSTPIEFVVSPSTTATVTLSAKILNNGDTPVQDPVTVTFYADEDMTQVIGTDEISSLYGCASATATVSVEWADLGIGAHRFWVEVDTVPQETDVTDNVASGIVFINPIQNFLPIIVR